MEDRHGRPRYRPEAMERLRRGFEVRVERRRRQQAPRIAYGQRLAAEQGLGRLGDVFRWNRKSRWWDPAAVVLILLALVTVFVGLPVGWKAGGTPLLVAIALLSAAVCVTLFVLLVRDPGRNDWIYSCDAGFVHVPHRALALLVVRWDQVVAIRRSWATTFSPSEEDYSPVPAGHVLLLEDGATLFLTRGYENVLDPWAGPMRGGFEAMRPVGQVLPRFPSLGDALERAVTGRLLPPATAAYERGEVVWFGPVGVGRQGIAVAPAQEALAWTEFGGLAQAGQALVLRKRSPGSGPAGPGAGRGSRPSALQDAVHNAGALMASAGLTIGGHSAGRRGTGQGDAWQVLDAGSVPNLCVLEAMLAQLQAGGPQESG